MLPCGTEEGVPVIAPEGFLEHAVSDVRDPDTGFPVVTP